MNFMLTCSIIINTYNRATYLERLLLGLQHLDTDTFEVVVVNGPSLDHTLKVIERFKEKIKVVSCLERNLSYSRNMGIKASHGDIVVFIDDDAIPGDDQWLNRFQETFSNDPAGTIGAIGGPVLHRDTDWYEFKGGATSDYGFQIFDETLATDIYSTQRWVPRVQGCNCAFRRSALEKIGGFDDYFTYYHDETDVCLRLDRAGYKTLHIQDNVVRHYAANSERRTSKYNRNWKIITRSDTYFALKNGLDNLVVRVWKTVIYLPKKHYVREVNSYLINHEISISQWFALIYQIISGFLAGLASLGYKKQNSLRENTSFTDKNEVATNFPIHNLNSMSIVLITQTIPGQTTNGGIGRYTFDLACGLYERGHRIHILCQSEQDFTQFNLNFSIYGIKKSEYESNSLSVLEKNISYSTWVYKKIKKLYEEGIIFDVVHASNWDCVAVSLVRAKVYPINIMLVTSLAQIIQTERWSLTDDLQECINIDKWQIYESDTVCIPSQGVLKSYIELMNIDVNLVKHLSITPLGIIPNNAVISKLEDLTKPMNRLLFVGRCERRKGIHVLLQALPNLLRDHLNWECHIVGNNSIISEDGKTFQEKFIQDFGKTVWFKRVIFHGQVSENELQTQYKSCDLFVAPSLFESFGLIYHEAMQYGKPVVGCYTGGVPETVADGIEGILVEPGNIDALTFALDKLMKDDELRQRMGKAGYLRIRERTNYQSMSLNMEMILTELIQRVGNPRRQLREHFWLRKVKLFGKTAEITKQGMWHIKHFSALEYIQGVTGSSLSLNVYTNTIIEITFLRHNWSGIVEVFSDTSRIQIINLFQEDIIEASYTVSILVPKGTSNLTSISLRVHEERDPMSYGTEVWIHQIIAHHPE